MDRFFILFRRTAAIALSAYFILLVLFLAGLAVDKAVGFGSVPFGIGKYFRFFCVLMYWVQFSFAKLILQSLPTSFLSAFLKAIDQNKLAILVIGNLVNTVLLFLASIGWSAIHSLAGLGDQKLVASSNLNKGT